MKTQSLPPVLGEGAEAVERRLTSMGVHGGEQHALANPNHDPLVMSKVVISTPKGQKGLDLDYRFPCTDALASPGSQA